MAHDSMTPSNTGEKITLDEHGVLVVPDVPIIACTPWQGTGDDLSFYARLVIDAAVEKAYGGQSQISWLETEENNAHPIVLDFKQQHCNLSSILLSALMLLRHMAWNRAADLVLKGIDGATKAKLLPYDAELVIDAACSSAKVVSVADFAQAVIEYMDDDAKSDVDQYDELADKFHDEFEAGAEKTVEFAQKAMETARKQLTVAGKFTEEQGQKFKTFLENDFARLSQEMKAGAKEKLNPARLSVGALSSMAKLLHKTGVALSGFADKADGALACKSGEITSAGKLKCNACGYEMNFKKTGRIPPCPKCHKTEFTKGY